MVYPNYFQGYYPQYSNGAMPDMLNQYKGQYQQPMQAVSSPIPSGSDSMIWVLSEVEAVSYPVAPGNTVILWDKNQDVVYVKSVNAQGVPSIRILDYTERTAQSMSKVSEEHECKCGKEFVSKEDFEALKDKFEDLSQKVETIAAPKTKKAKEDAE